MTLRLSFAESGLKEFGLRSGCFKLFLLITSKADKGRGDAWRDALDYGLFLPKQPTRYPISELPVIRETT
jgi:hypothetical protein